MSYFTAWYRIYSTVHIDSEPLAAWVWAAEAAPTVMAAYLRYYRLSYAAEVYFVRFALC